MLARTIEHYHIQLLLSVIIIGTALFGLFPAFEKPDEDTHFFKAIAVSQGKLICSEKNGKVVNPIPPLVHRFVLDNSPQTRSELLITNEIKSCSLPFMFYIIPGIWHFLATELRIPLIFQFFLGRMINITIALSLLIISLRNLPKQLQSLSLFVFALPMTMYQVSSYSKDSYHFGMGAFIVNSVLLAWKQKRITFSRLLALGICMILFILTRPQYFWFILFFTSLPAVDHVRKRLFGTFHLNIWFIAITVLTTGIILGLLIKEKVYLSPNNPNTELNYYKQINPQLQIQYSLSHPFAFVQAIFSSLLTFGIFYIKGLIGILGPLDRPLPTILYFCYILGGMMVMVSLMLSKSLSIVTRHTPVLLFITCFTGINIFLAMYLYGTPVGGSTIYGVQGRYFILLVPLILMIFSVSLHSILFSKKTR